MKKLMIHFFHTLMMAAAVVAVALLPFDPTLKYANAVIFGMVGCLLIAIGVYLYRGHKKGLFCGLLFVLMLGMSGMALAACPKLSEADKQEYKNQMNKYYLNYCSIKGGFDADKMVDSGLKMTKQDYDNYLKAVQYYAAWERAKEACVTDNAWFWKGDEQKQRDCAKEFMEEVADYLELTAEAAMKTVKTLLENEKENCWPCGIAHVLVDAMEHICLTVEDTFKSAALQLLGIMLLFYIMIKVLILIGQFGTASNADFFTDLLKRCLIAMIAASFLYLPMAELYKMTLSPLVEATAGLTGKIANLSGADFTGNGNANAIGSQLMGGTTLTDATCNCCRDGYATQARNKDKEAEQKRLSGSTEWMSTSISDCNGGKLGGQVNSILTFSAKRSLMCMSCAVYKQTAPMVAAGRVMIYDSTHASSMLGSAARWLLKVFTAGTLDKVPYPIGMWFVGMILAICFTLLGWSIAFRIIDIFIRIGFAIIVTPFLVVTYVFPISRQYTQRGWEFLVHALLSIMALSIGIAFVMSVLMVALTGSLSGSSTSQLKSMMQAGESNKYGCNLYRVWIGLRNQGNNCEYDTAGVGGSFMPMFVILIMTFFGMNILKSTTVIVEGLTGITCGIPSVSGAAVMGAIKASLAPLKMAASVAAEKMSMAGNPDKDVKAIGGKDGEKKGIFAKLSQYTLEKAGKLEAGNSVSNAGKGMEAAGKGMEAGGKGMEMAGDAMEKGGAAAGTAMDTAGKGTTKAGAGMMKAGAGITGGTFGIGAIVGVPLMIAGAAVAGTGLGMQATGKAVKAGSKIAGKMTKMAGKVVKATGKVQQKVGKVTQKVGKAVQKVGNVVQKGRRLAAKGLRGISRGAAKMQRGVDMLKAAPRKIANRMKGMIPPKARKVLSNIKNAPKNLKKKFMKKTRRARAALKYAKRKLGIHDKPPVSGGSGGKGSKGGSGSGKPSLGRRMAIGALDKTVAGIDRVNESADRNFGEGATSGYAASDEAKSGQATEMGWQKPDDGGSGS